MTGKKVSVLVSITKLHKILVRYKKDIGVIYMFAILAGLVQLSLPLGIQSIISFVMAGSISTSIIVLIGMVVFGVFINGLLQVKQMEIIEKIKQQLFLRCSFEYSYELPRLDIAHNADEYLPEVVNRFFDSVSLQKGLDKLLLELPAAVIQVILGLILLAFYHPVFIGLGTMLILFVVLMLRFTSAKGLSTAMDASGYKYKMAAWLQDIARSIITFKYAAGNMLHMQKTDLLTANYLTSHSDHFKILVRQYWSLISFKVLITASMLIIGAVLLVKNQINVGQFVAADIVIIVIINSIEKLINNIDVVYQAIVSAEKLSVIAEAKKETGGALPITDINKGITVEFKKVHFNYAANTPAIQNISFNLPAGKTGIIVGVPGSGKRTILKLLTGIYNNFSGSILLDNIPLGNYDTESLRSRTGILLGDYAIFEGTIMQNLTMGNAIISLEEVRNLVALTGLQSFIEANKDGYETILQPVGHNLSSHTRKNILLVRALLGRTRLLLLQEPFRHLQEPYKTAVMKFIKEQKKTTLIITSNAEEQLSYNDIIIRT